MLTEKEQIEEQIRKAGRILITAPKGDRDGLASGLALLLFLRKIGKNADLVIENLEEEKALEFLPGFGEAKDSFDGLQNLIVSIDVSRTKVDAVKYELRDDRLNFIISPKSGSFTGEEAAACSCDYKYDLIVTLGAPDLESLGKNFEASPDFFYKTPVINIDNRSANESYGQINLIELTAVSLAEIILPLMKSLDERVIDEEIATCLLAAIITKTRNFRVRSVSPRLLETASDLIALGGRKEDIINRLYRSLSFNVLKLWGRVLARLESGLDGQLVWSVLNRVDFEKTEAKEKDLDEVIEEIINIVPAAKAVVLVYESEIGETRAVVHSAGLNLLDLTADFNPQGDKRLVRLEIKEPLSTGAKAILGGLENKLKVILENQ